MTMNKFSDRSQQMLNSCHLDLQRLFTEVVKNYDCIIICGHRTQAAQNVVVAEGKSQTPWPTSKHNSSPSMAVDVAPYFATNPHIRWDDPGAFYIFAGYVLRVAEEMGIAITYGGDWNRNKITKDQTFNDLPHFQLAV